ncbi:hypothetical protein ALI22I_02900 [Saccharothrix sp. ALI-22-I]|uniref:hypothetical protein n=1 Tax=Saccharothrix sp. ALI-22-I TaxID=1933778 RepID=UPI00097C732A|nr:hypothetical protein [Saccharothrix sp. ALI-22-I]ONI92631.1 hypothetical protein ALI22I_02900 [Saccharothrix sp. ALI-22-I]
MAESAFRGLYALLSAVKDLSERPLWSRSKHGGLRGDRPLPLLCLINGQTDGFLADLGKLMDGAGAARIPVVRVDVDEAKAASEARWAGLESESPLLKRDSPLLPLLDEIRHRLSADRFGTLRPSRFRRYRLVDWLTGKRLNEGDNRNELTDITHLLRLWHARWERPEAARQAAIEVSASLPAPVRFLVALLFAWHRPLRFWLWTRGSRLTGGEPRWLMRQPFMLPGHSTSFTGFAELLTVGRQNDDNLPQLKELLVHAFLQDLRELYGPGTWRLRRWRRTAYTVVLLDNVREDNGGWELLGLINDVRNQSTEHDPVLVVATSPSLPARLEQRTPQPASEITDEIRDWYRELPARRQTLRRDARFITVALPSTGGEEAGERDRRAWDTHRDLLRPRPVPVPARRSFIAVTVALALLAAGLTGGRWLVARIAEDCLPSARAGVVTAWIETQNGGECVGYSDSAAQVFGKDERLRKAQLAVFELNREAERLAEASGHRPLVTVVYFAEFTSPTVPDDSAGAITEELTGLLIRQSHDNTEGDLPLLRVVVANGGHKMRHARTVVDRLLAPLFAADSTAMGVIGMGRTVPSTESAIGALGDLGIPVVATTLTGQGLGDRSPMYFQLVPGNEKQVALLREFSERQGKEVTVYQPADVEGDSYMKTLRESLKKALGADESWLVTWRGPVRGIEPRCDTEEVDRIAYFAGREYDFDGFLDTLFEECEGRTPVVVGNDTTSRFIADGGKRTEKHRGRSMSYVSLANAVVHENRTCLSSDREGADEPSRLCAGLLDLRSGKAGRPAWSEFGRKLEEDATVLPWIGERIGVAYDGAGLFVHAVKENRFKRPRVDAAGAPLDGAAVGPPNRAAIGQELRELSCPPEDRDAVRGSCYKGVSGKIGFSVDRTGESRPVALLAIADIADLGMVPTCVYMLPPADALCPPPTP